MYIFFIRYLIICKNYYKEKFNNYQCYLVTYAVLDYTHSFDNKLRDSILVSRV